MLVDLLRRSVPSGDVALLWPTKMVNAPIQPTNSMGERTTAYCFAPDGALWCAQYERRTSASTQQSIRFKRSTDLGTTWTYMSGEFNTQQNGTTTYIRMESTASNRLVLCWGTSSSTAYCGTILYGWDGSTTITQLGSHSIASNAGSSSITPVAVEYLGVVNSVDVVAVSTVYGMNNSISLYLYSISGSTLTALANSSLGNSMLTTHTMVVPHSADYEVLSPGVGWIHGVQAAPDLYSVGLSKVIRFVWNGTSISYHASTYSYAGAFADTVQKHTAAWSLNASALDVFDARMNKDELYHKRITFNGSAISVGSSNLITSTRPDGYPFNSVAVQNASDLALYSDRKTAGGNIRKIPLVPSGSTYTLGTYEELSSSVMARPETMKYSKEAEAIAVIQAKDLDNQAILVP